MPRGGGKVVLGDPETPKSNPGIMLPLIVWLQSSELCDSF